MTTQMTLCNKGMTELDSLHAICLAQISESTELNQKWSKSKKLIEPESCDKDWQPCEYHEGNEGLNFSTPTTTPNHIWTNHLYTHKHNYRWPHIMTGFLEVTVTYLVRSCNASLIKV